MTQTTSVLALGSEALSAFAELMFAHAPVLFVPKLYQLLFRKAPLAFQETTNPPLRRVRFAAWFVLQKGVKYTACPRRVVFTLGRYQLMPVSEAFPEPPPVPLPVALPVPFVWFPEVQLDPEPLPLPDPL